MAEPKTSSDKPSAEAKAAAGDLPERVAKANEQGYYGETPDDTPNENYTLKGVTSGKPTPETERGTK